MRQPKCARCGHALYDFSASAYCTRLDCWCHPHGACEIPTVRYLRDRGFGDEEIAKHYTIGLAPVEEVAA